MERTYIIPLRRGFLKVPIYKRTEKAVKVCRVFLKKHMKVDNVKMGRHLNMLLWSRGTKNPPHKVHVSVELIKDKEGDYAYAELVGVEKEMLKPIIEEKKEGLAGKLEKLTGGKKEEPKEGAKKAQDDKFKEEKVKEKVLKEETVKTEAPKAAEGKDVTPEVSEKAREENLVKRDNKQEQHKKK